MKFFASVWDFFVNSSLYFQNTLSSKWLIGLGIVSLIIAIVCAVKACEVIKDGEAAGGVKACNLTTPISIFWTFFFISVNDFKDYAEADSTFGPIVMSFMYLVIFIHLVCGYINGTFYYSLGTIVFAMLFAILFSKIIIIIAIIFLVIVTIIGGGDNYLGTFTDRNGNSFDIFKRD